MNEELMEFISQIQSWHERKTSYLREIQEQIVEGTKLIIEAKDSREEPTSLTKRDATLMKLGMETVLMELGKLPFTVSQNSEYDDEAKDDSDD